MRHIELQKSSAASTLFALLLFTFIAVAATACRSSSDTNAPDAASAGLVIVNAPATGEVRRVIASEGAQVNKGALILEIAVRQETPNASPQAQGEDAQARARHAAQSAQAQVAAARAESERASVEVERMTALVASNSAPQPQLDAARAQYQRAQEQLQRVQQNVSATAAIPPPQQANNANASQVAMTAPREQIIAVRASTAGTVRAIGVNAGEHVTAGQALATIRTNDR